jgi:hypothetical protein
MKYRDPIVEQVRAARDEIARECDYDVDKLVAALRRRAAEDGRQLVTLPPRRPLAWRKAS